MDSQAPFLVLGGEQDDEDIKVMLNGSFLWKIKSRRRKKERFYRLQEDGLTILSERCFKRAPPEGQIVVFSIMHIEAMREGYQSEGLRKHGRYFPETQCLTIVFKGRRKNLDLAAQSEEEAKRWARGLKKLMAKVEAMICPPLFFPYISGIWIHDILHRADKNKDNKMSFKEIKDMLKMINIDMNDIYAYQLFQECDKSSNDRLEEHEIEEFCTLLMKRPELEELFHRYSGQDCVLSAKELGAFLQDQGEVADLAHAHRIIQTYELSEKAKQHDRMMLDGFMMYLLSAAGDILNQEHTNVYQDMSQPLCHYFISTSHNTYLTDNQIGGASSTEAYIRAFMEGCRCVELDCWEGSNGEPIIYHGHTLTSKILFRDVIEIIRDYAFKHSSYPVILSLENHCGLEQQVTMVRHMKAILGDMLLTQTLDGQVPKELPSPEVTPPGNSRGRGRGPWQHSHGLLQGGFSERGPRAPSSMVSSHGHPWALSDPIAVCAPRQAKDAAQLCPQLSDLVVYCQAVPFQSLAQALGSQQAGQMCSFSESKARKLLKESGNGLVRYNAQHLSRIYPLGLKMNSSNYNPQEMWNAGCQLVALNFQTPGWEMDLNHGRFLVNGRCGYVLKPSFLRSRQASFDPESGRGGVGPMWARGVITAQQLPKLNDKKSSIVDPFVRVEIHGVRADCTSKQTEYKLNNGFNPRWDETLSFQLRVPELALVRFVVEDYDATSCNDFVGQFTLPFISLREGYRHIHLLSRDGASLAPATLFVHIKAKKM
uniref:Phosphoinositide phospholipase C n=1 Tax=Gopherus evgoodei TaxID=1825980 RepID=A0A8C4YMP3_9SAUR